MARGSNRVARGLLQPGRHPNPVRVQARVPYKQGSAKVRFPKRSFHRGCGHWLAWHSSQVCRMRRLMQCSRMLSGDMLAVATRNALNILGSALWMSLIVSVNIRQYISTPEKGFQSSWLIVVLAVALKTLTHMMTRAALRSPTMTRLYQPLPRLWHTPLQSMFSVDTACGIGSLMVRWGATHSSGSRVVVGKVAQPKCNMFFNSFLMQCALLEWQRRWLFMLVDPARLPSCPSKGNR
jgi:hypothetical protein